MNRITVLSSITLLLLLSTNLLAQTGDAKLSNTPPEVTIAGTRLLSINNAIRLCQLF
jgi:hypothetical protein